MKSVGFVTEQLLRLRVRTKTRRREASDGSKTMKYRFGMEKVLAMQRLRLLAIEWEPCEPSACAACVRTKTRRREVSNGRTYAMAVGKRQSARRLAMEYEESSAYASFFSLSLSHIWQFSFVLFSHSLLSRDHSRLVARHSRACVRCVATDRTGRTGSPRSSKPSQ